MSSLAAAPTARDAAEALLAATLLDDDDDDEGDGDSAAAPTRAVGDDGDASAPHLKPLEAPRRLKPLAAVPSTTKYVKQTVTMKPEWRAGEATCIDDRSAGYKL